jgi:hypothetical protein
LISDGHSYGEPDKVTAVMEFLLSDDASFVTSSPYTVDGGTMWLQRAALSGVPHSLGRSCRPPDVPVARSGALATEGPQQ